MKKKHRTQISAAAVSALILAASVTVPFNYKNIYSVQSPAITANAADITLADLPSEYQYAADWIWQNRITAEQSTARQNTIFDQIIAGKGTINYVVRWQSYKTITLEQRKAFETMLEKCYNDWNKWLAGYENWPYDHIDVNIVGWAVLDKNCLLDLQPDEIVYDNLITDYDSTYDTSNGIETIPDKLPSAPSELSRFDHFTDKTYEYPGGLDKRFDMYLWATQGFPSIGGCGGDWGQRLSDDAYINMLSVTGIHVLEHEIGHGFGMTDFYGGEGESDGFPPGGFPGNGTSIMMAGSSAEITDFDGWMLRYMWSMIKDEEGRFDIEEVPEETTTTTTTTTVSVTTETTTVTTVSESETVTTATSDTGSEIIPAEFTQDEYGNWNFDANHADAVKLTFKAQSWAALSGVIGYWIDEWKTVDWEANCSESDTVSIIVPLSDDVTTASVQKYYSAVWSNEENKMVDVYAELTGIELIYNTGEITTTNTTNSETSATVSETTATETENTTAQEQLAVTLAGDANCDGKVNISDAVAVAAYVSNANVNPLTPQGKVNADVYMTGDDLNASDAFKIQQIATGIYK